MGRVDGPDRASRGLFSKKPSNFSRINPQSMPPLSFFSKKPSTHTKKKTVHPPHPGASSLAAYAPTPWQTPAGPRRCLSAARVPAAASLLSLSLPTWWRCSSYYQLVLLERAPLNQYYSTIAANRAPESWLLLSDGATEARGGGEAARHRPPTSSPGRCAAAAPAPTRGSMTAWPGCAAGDPRSGDLR